MNIRALALAGASLLCLTTPALAGGDGWYLGLGAGYSQLEDIKTTATTTGGKIEYKDTARYIASAGYKMPSGFRLELEGGWASYPVKDAFNGNGARLTGAQGWTSVGTLLINGAYDFPITPDFAFTLGAGIGAGRTEIKYFDTATFPGLVGPAEIDRGANTAFAYQLIAGIVWSISPQLDLQIDYRWVSVGKTEVFHSSAFGVPSGNKSLGDANSNNIMRTLRRFLASRST